MRIFLELILVRGAVGIWQLKGLSWLKIQSLLTSYFYIDKISAKPKGGHGHHDDDHHRHGKYHHDVRKCPQPVTHPNLPMKCTVADDCNTFSCSAEIGDETVTLTLKIDTSQEPMSAKVSLKVPSRNYDWSHTLKSGEKIQVPGFPLAIRGLMDADMFLMFTMSKEEGGVAFEVIYSRFRIKEPVIIYLLRGGVVRGFFVWWGGHLKLRAMKGEISHAKTNGKSVKFEAVDFHLVVW